MSKLVQDQAISIINENGDTELGFTIFNPRVDKEGLIFVKKGDQVSRIHPRRIITGESMSVNESESETATTTATATATLDETKPVITKIKEVKKPKLKVNVEPKAQPEKADLDSIATNGELWVKNGVDFNGKIDCKTLALIAIDKNRYLSFNIYNGTFGRKGKQPPIQQLINGELVDGKDVGYPIKDIIKLREKLARDGYVIHESQQTSNIAG